MIICITFNFYKEKFKKLIKKLYNFNYNITKIQVEKVRFVCNRLHLDSRSSTSFCFSLPRLSFSLLTVKNCRLNILKCLEGLYFSKIHCFKKMEQIRDAKRTIVLYFQTSSRGSLSLSLDCILLSLFPTRKNYLKRIQLVDDLS